MNLDLDWLPNYTIRRSKRAKRVNLRLCSKYGLLLTLPLRTSENTGLQFLYQQKDWILKHQHLLQSTIDIPTLPKEIILPSFEKMLQVRYEIVTGYKKIKLLHLPNELVLYSEKLEIKKCLEELRQWLYMYAEKEFTLWLKQLSTRCQLSFQSMSLRNQATRWGSCTYSKKISLNIKLAFLPKTITEYVLIHELCHTKYLNHSEDFWNLVELFVPDYRRQILLLKKITSKDFPNWIE